MHWPLLIAGFGTALSALVHTVAGERTNIRHLLQSNVPITEQIEVRAIWHMISLMLALSAGVLIVAAASGLSDSMRVLVRAIAAYYLLCGIVLAATIVITHPRLLLRVPQWLLFQAIAGLAWWGTL